MKKRNKALLTLALTGAIALSGVGGLYVSMAKTMQEDMTTQVESKVDLVLEENTKKTVDNQTWQEQESIYLPDGAKLSENQDGGYDITWGNYDITFWQGDGLLKESQEDLGLAKLMPILEDTIKEYSGQKLETGKIEIAMYGPSDMGTQEEMVGFARLYDYNTNWYEVCVLGVDQHEYSICVDSVTGEVLAFSHLDDSLGSFSHEWVPAEGNDDWAMSEEEKTEYDSVIKSFVFSELELGNVQKTYGQHWGLTCSENHERASYSALCKTDNGTVVEVTVDCETKAVTAFNINSAYLSEVE